MDMMMPNQNMYQGYMQHQQYDMQQQQQPHQQLQQQQQHHGYYDNQKMPDQCMMYSNRTNEMDNGYPQNDLSMMMNKHYRTDSVQLLRCRRRMDLARLQQSFKTHPTTVARRNERERNRVKHINSTFSNLRQHLPTSAKSKKMSKVDTLRCAIRYINHLQTILQDDQCDDVTTTDFSPLSPSESLKSCPATPSTCRTDSPLCESLQDGSSPEQDLLSPAGRDALSPCTETTSQGSPTCLRSASPYTSDDASYETLETTTDDLTDLVNWFQ